MFKTIEDLLDWRSRKVTRMSKGQSAELHAIARAIDVPIIGHDGGPVPEKLTVGISRSCQGIYHPLYDKIGIFPHQIMLAGHSTIDGVLAHEIIHATGHYKRLTRGPIGAMTPYPGVVDLQQEEMVAQYGGMVLLKKLGLCTPAEEKYTADYIKRVGRVPSGEPPDQARIDAIRAVKYVLTALEKYRRRENHAAQGAA